MKSTQYCYPWMLSGLFRVCHSLPIAEFCSQMNKDYRSFELQQAAHLAHNPCKSRSLHFCKCSEQVSKYCSGLANQQSQGKWHALTHSQFQHGDEHLTRALTSKLHALLASISDYHHHSEKQVPNIKEQHSYEIAQSLLHEQGGSCRHGDHSRSQPDIASLYTQRSAPGYNSTWS